MSDKFNEHLATANNDTAAAVEKKEEDPLDGTLKRADKQLADSIDRSIKLQKIEGLQKQQQVQAAETDTAVIDAETKKQESQNSLAVAKAQSLVAAPPQVQIDPQQQLVQERYDMVKTLVANGTDMAKAMAAVFPNGQPVIQQNQQQNQQQNLQEMPASMTNFVNKAFDKALATIDKDGSQQQPTGALANMAQQLMDLASMKNTLGALFFPPTPDPNKDAPSQDQQVKAYGLIRSIDDQIKMESHQFSEWKARLELENDMKIQWKKYDQDEKRMDKFGGILNDGIGAIGRIMQPGGVGVDQPAGAAQNELIEMLCPHCSTALNVPLGFPQAQCPHCKQAFDVPGGAHA